MPTAKPASCRPRRAVSSPPERATLRAPAAPLSLRQTSKAVHPIVSHIGIGANLGDAAATVDAAVDRLAALPDSRLLARSASYRTAPVEASGPQFVNAVAAVETRLPARTLLHAILAIERDFGRERPYRNAPRTLDLDLLLYGDAVIDEPDLIVPHPRMHLRAFVLAPLAELAPGLSIPRQGPVDQWLARCTDQRLERITP